MAGDTKVTHKMTPALAIFVKTPGLSPVKTRLATTLGRIDATRFHTLAAAATAAVASQCLDALTPYWAVAETGAQTHMAWPGFAHVWQGNGELGTRLHHVYTQLQAHHGKVVLIGADAPQLTATLLENALVQLHENAGSFVLGEATDGGFWLFGGQQPLPRHVWLDVHYSQTDTASQLRQALTGLGTIAPVPALRDVDNAEDLPALAESINALSRPLPAQRELGQWLQDVLDQGFHHADTSACPPAPG